MCSTGKEGSPTEFTVRVDHYIHHEGTGTGDGGSVNLGPITQMLQHIIEAQEAEAQWHLAERTRDMGAEQDLRDLAAANNAYSNRIAASVTGVGSDLQALKDLLAQGTVTPEAVAILTNSINATGELAAALEAMDSAFPVTEPTPPVEPTPPTEPVVVPPIEEAPGTEPIPTDGGTV